MSKVRGNQRESAWKTAHTSPDNKVNLDCTEQNDFNTLPCTAYDPSAGEHEAAACPHCEKVPYPNPELDSASPRPLSFTPPTSTYGQTITMPSIRSFIAKRWPIRKTKTTPAPAAGAASNTTGNTTAINVATAAAALAPAPDAALTSTHTTRAGAFNCKAKGKGPAREKCSPPVVIVPDPATLANSFLQSYADDLVPMGMLVANELTAMSSGPSMKAEQVEGADELEERGRATGPRTGESAGGTIGDASRAPTEMEEALPANDDAVDARRGYWDMGAIEWHDMQRWLRCQGRRAGEHAVDTVYTGYGSIAREGWEAFGHLMQNLEMWWQALCGFFSNIWQYGFDPWTFFSNIIGTVYYLVAFAFNLACSFVVAVWPYHLLLTLMTMLKVIFGMNVVGLAIGMLKSLPGWIKSKASGAA
ncbi:hypothetical protein CALVIDRAFT_553183 [Calocera viscosa TUFC12733]|uniref:Uncharacterized protein n=1 Tax=Calocera viscosa (strain TUFC12733) TaxID=1330018 RepID=A0A167QGR3_CALVF|nr:hypothetical protein CALVIDRAFT_553183 [Calocera viscosa TUFC12733]